MARGHQISLSLIRRLMLPSMRTCHINEWASPNLLYFKNSSPSSINTLGCVTPRSLHISHCLREADKGHQKVQDVHHNTSGSQKPTSTSQVKSFSVLKYIKKSLPFSLKLDVPIGKFSTGSGSEMSKNLGNFRSSKTRLFEFFSFRELLSTPSPFMLYGLGGLIPFSSVPIYMHITSSYIPDLAFVQLVYGACILSFLGGVSWGFELLQPRNASLKSLGYSIFLPLLSWTGVMMYPSVTAFPILITGVAFAGYIDTHYQHYPLWFKNLRFLLSSLVILSLFSTFVFSFTKSNDTLTSEKPLDGIR